MILRLKRVTRSSRFTMGVLIKEDTGVPICVTLENPWLNNKPFKSCIPPGIYRVERFYGNKFDYAYGLVDVKDRSVILIHKGNTETDTSGCILVGTNFGYLRSQPAILGSADAFNVIDSICEEKAFELIIE